MLADTWDDGAAAPRCIHTVAISNATAALRAHRQLMATVPPQIATLAAGGGERLRSTQVLEITVTPGPDSAKGAAGGHRARWLVSHGLGTGSAMRVATASESVQYGLRLLPWAGVAAPLSTTLAAPGITPSTDGQVYVFLPLPVKTGLPVHVNGFFEVR